jgi:hypothetical protein
LELLEVLGLLGFEVYDVLGGEWGGVLALLLGGVECGFFDSAEFEVLGEFLGLREAHFGV